MKASNILYRKVSSCDNKKEWERKSEKNVGRKKRKREKRKKRKKEGNDKEGKRKINFTISSHCYCKTLT